MEPTAKSSLLQTVFAGREHAKDEPAGGALVSTDPQLLGYFILVTTL